MKVITQTLCPTWDETLIFDDIVVYGVREELVKNPPVVIVEIYDYDVIVSLQLVLSSLLLLLLHLLITHFFPDLV